MGMNMKTKIRDFHQAKWDEPIIFELSCPGERGILPPMPEPEIAAVGDPVSELPSYLRRTTPPALPEMAQMKVVKHYTRLSQENLGSDLNIDVGQGTCTMKYSPKINDLFAKSPKLADLHPLQDERTVQGSLEIIWRLEQLMKEISGLDRFCMSFGGGSQALLGIATAVRSWVEAKGESETRNEIISTVFSHPCNAAASKLKGFKVITVYPDEDGIPDYEAFKAAVSSRTAAFLVTNAEDTGIFNPRIKEYTDMVHAAGGICSYDQANANGLFGITRAKESGFDITFTNLHKAFSSPHGCGGPGSGIIGVTNELIPFLPGPLVNYDAKQDRYFLNTEETGKDLRVKDYYGVLPAIVRAYAWIMNLGAEGLKEVSRVCVLNNNYFLKKILEMPGTSAPYAEGKHRLEQVRFSFQKLKDETGFGIQDVQNRIFDFGLHIWTSHEPFLVPEPFTLEPTEAYSKDELDEYLAVLRHIIDEAYTNPEVLKEAPHRSTIHRIISDGYFDDPEKWAITWRAYKKKYNGYFQLKR